MKSAQVEYTERESHPDKLSSFELKDGYLECVCENDLTMRIYAVTDHILRFRYAIDARFEKDFSYAIDPKFQSQSVDLKLEDTNEYLFLHTPSVSCRIKKENLSIAILDKEGNLISKDEKGFHWEEHSKYGGYIVQNSKYIQDGEAFYGLGDKPTDLNLKGRRFCNWGMDEYGYKKDTDPLYKNIPIVYGLHNGVAYGIFFDNSFKSYFDFGSERSHVFSFWAQGGEMNYYFIAGPNLMDVCERYTKLTGTPDMPPMWALGFQQCKWSYYPESRVKEITSKMRELQIPCDAIYLDIDYMDGFRCFTWDAEKFPDPKRMVNELSDQGFKTMVIIDPGIKIDKDYFVYQQAVENDYFCKRIDGHYVKGKVWPGDCYFPDFTRPDVREWWAGLYKELIEETGIAGVWNDMNEPALFEVESKTFPYDVIHDYDGHPTSHRKAHNIYGMQMARATAEGVKKFRNGKRTLIITRSGYSGLQRYSSVWTGDNIASWEHLWIADVQAQRLAVSGVSFCGSDIGGFIEQPTAEMMVRWIQLGIFHPFCRVHSSGDHGDQEPWAFGEECTQLFKRFVEIRYQLLSYIYTSFYQYHRFGTPMLRPLCFVDQKNPVLKDKDHEFLCGDHILISPVVEEGANKKKVYLPSGHWINYWTGEKYNGSAEYVVDAPLDKIPFFVRAGAIIPKLPVQQYVGEKEISKITLDIYYGSDQCTSYLYQDNQEDFDYEKGQFLYSKFNLQNQDGQIKITQDTEGDYLSQVRHFDLNLISFPLDEFTIEVDGKKIDGMAVPSGFKEIKILS